MGGFALEVSHLVSLLMSGFAALALGAIVSLMPVPSSRTSLSLSHGLAALGAASLAACAAGVLLTGHPLNLGSLELIPALGALRFRVDTLSAYFLLLISSLSIAASVFAIGYTTAHDGPEAPSPALLGGMWNLFIAGMAAVMLAADGLGFLYAWELMSLFSFVLVIAEHRKPEARQAGYFYVVMTHVGTAFLTGAFLILFSRSGSLDFAGFRQALPDLPIGLRNTLFLLLLVGFGTKAGLVPLHVWLPRAHPAAPSHVSALMSGAMVKTALYGMLRFAFDILGGGPSWWGGLLILIGGISGVAGALYATQESHLKRLLAYSTIDNVGLLFMGVGAALVAQANGLDTLSQLALGAVLFHAVSHAAFKGLAFMGAGAVLQGAGTVDMERLGGLIRRMPRTAALFLVAAAAIAGLPILSGFVGEWLSLQTFLYLAQAEAGFAERLGGLVGVGAIGLATGLGAAAAVKCFGITFLALPRSREAEQAHDASVTMLAGMLMPAVAILGLGVFPGAALALAGPVITELLPGSGTILPGWAAGPLAPLTVVPTITTGVAADLQPLFVPTSLLMMVALAILATVILGRGWPRWRRGVTWTCGIEANARMEYTGAGYSKPILLMFRGLLQPVRSLRADPSIHPLFPGQVHYHSELKAIFELHLYRPVTQAVMGAASRLRRMQTGSLQTYLLYLLLAAVGVIVAAR